MPDIYDNINLKLLDGLKEQIRQALRADFCVGYFNIRGWNAIAAEIEKLPGAIVSEQDGEHRRYARVLVGMQKAPIDELRDAQRPAKIIDHEYLQKQKQALAREFRAQLVLGVPTDDYKQTIEVLKKQIDEDKVVIKLYLKQPLHAKLYMTYVGHTSIGQIGFLGSSNLTASGLSVQGELNTDITERSTSEILADWFDERWNDSKCVDITDDLRAVLEESWNKEISPYEIYIKIAYHLSREARNTDFNIPRAFESQLFAFQKQAVSLAAHHLNKRGGVVIGDVVGLGKTITAAAVARIFQEDFSYETLILCPKNLVSMWEEYVQDYRLIAKVMSQSVVTNELPDLRRYRLVIIDESHNFRNNDGKRYRAIKEYIAENDSKVMLLSATPYNTSYLDLANQLRLFVSDDFDLGIRPEQYINSLGGPIQYAARYPDIPMRSLSAFETSTSSDDWQDLMRLYLVRRTRSFIKRHYAIKDTETDRYFLSMPNGERSYFPDRIPKAVQFQFNENDTTDQYAKLYSNSVVDIIENLDLPRYGLDNYVRSDKRKTAAASELRLLENLSRAGKRLKGFSRTSLFKRLESSGYAFLLSLERHILRNCLFLYAISTNQPLPIGTSIFSDIDEFIDDQDIDETTNSELPIAHTLVAYMEKAKLLYEKSSADIRRRDSLPSSFFSDQLRTHLERDAQQLLTVRNNAHRWDPARDQKLLALFYLVSHTHANEKVLVFTQYADTAGYLGEQLQALGVSAVASVTGDNEDPKLMARRFSPRGKSLPQGVAPIRVLIATDVLSEGQNLQDAHIVVNFDLPWALVRLIQRVGRVDRIGQQSSTILGYSFLPAEGIEKIINLRNRLHTRITSNAEVIGTDEVFFEGDPVNLKDMYNERSGLLDGESNDSEIDLASYALQIWRNACEHDPSLQHRIPAMAHWSYSGKHFSHTDKRGAIVYGRTHDDTDVLTWLDTSGTIVSQSQLNILNALHCNPSTGRTEPLPNHLSLVAESVEHIRQQAQSMAGTLGKRTSIKYRLYQLLTNYQHTYNGTLFAREEINQAINDIYQFPLQERAQDTIRRQLKAGVDHDSLVLMVLGMREENALILRNDDVDADTEPQIICSLSLTA
jgi:superfamily II DNA or RNA helicase